MGTLSLTHVFHSSDSRHRARNGASCSIVRALRAAEADLHEVGPMYRIRFEDGAEIDVFHDELNDL